MHRNTAAGMGVAVMLAVFGYPQPGVAEPLPVRIGQCGQTAIKEIATRLVDGATDRPIPGSGSAVNFTNGGYQVSYDTVRQLARSRAGDPATMCLVSIPTGCPPGDTRGREYKTTNLRTNESWVLPDSQHRCGGA